MASRRTWLLLLISVAVGTVALNATPPLTTIQDTLYSADGSPFNGYVFIEWKTFQASDYSNVAANSISLAIVDGLLHVQLVPTSNAVSQNVRYSVRYNAAGKAQFTETWNVPPSGVSVRLRDVRLSSTNTAEFPINTLIQMGDVVGLTSELAIRPIKGPAFAPSRALIVNGNGEVDAVVGNLADCVRVDGTSGPCGNAGAALPGFVDGETPAGLVNGTNTTFTLANAPTPPSSLLVYRNGILQKAGLDYTSSGNTVAFASAATPQAGDVLQATYRLPVAGTPAGGAGGALTGSYPNPQIALNVIANDNISPAAAIAESKLALNFPTHPSANDPNPGEKAALGGTAGTPSSSNRYVTDQDLRMSNSRPALPHSLLSTAHSDTTVSTVVRGDVVVGQGTPATWSRLPIGPANRCLISNGVDALWNTCLFTGFPAGSVPFVDATGILTQNSGRLFWDNPNRRLSIGNNQSLATLFLFDSTTPNGATSLVVRAGQGQAGTPLTQWAGSSGAEVGRVDDDGQVHGSAFSARTSATRAAYRDAGAVADPSARVDGDEWFNTAAAAHKAQAGGRVHTAVQVLCSAVGISTSSTAPTSLGSCTIPPSLLKQGDRVEVMFNYSHEGSATGYSVQLRWGATNLFTRSAAAAEVLVTGQASAGLHAAGAFWNASSWGTTLTHEVGAGTAAESLSSPITISFMAQMASGTTETVTLRGFTVVRYPSQQNP